MITHINLFLFFMASILSINICGLRSHDKIDRFLSSLREDIICIQETKWDTSAIKYVAQKWRGEIYSSFGTQNSCGVATLFRKDSVKNIKCIHKDNHGRLVITDFTCGNNEIRLINMYASCNEAERKELFKDLAKWTYKDCIIIGDFNVVLTKMDLSNNNIFRSDTSRAALFELISAQNMIDAWRINNPTKREFSRRQIVLGILKQSRIDLCLVSANLVKQINSIKYVFNTLSDHAHIVCELGRCSRARGGGVWAFNASLTQQKEFKRKIIKLLDYASYEASVAEDINAWWDEVKTRIKKACINFSKQKKWLDTRKEKELKELINNEVIKIDTIPDYNAGNYIALKDELDVIEKNRCRGAAIRSRARDVLEGEKCTAYFLGLEKQKQNKAYISELSDGNGNKVSNLEGILKIIQNYYKNLFTSEKLNQEQIIDTLKIIDKKVSIEDRDWCDNPLSMDEVELAIDSLNKNKSPGIDGLSAEFYSCFKKQLAPILLKVYNNINLKQTTPDSLTTGLITLVYKNKGDNKKLENYRPISLLNTDYKILAKILANRLKTVIGSLIDFSQTYSIPGRDISDTICTIRDLIREMNSQGGIFLGVDLNKAFDRVEHNFLFETLQKFGFGPEFIKWIKLLYKNAKSRVKCNGTLTEEIMLERSVRQGCPLSSLLYSLVAEPLALLIKNDKDVQGIKIAGGEETKIIQYADDINITVKNKESIEKVIQHLKCYESVAGAKVNTDKSIIMYCGNVKRTEEKWDFKEEKEEVKILGIYMGINEEVAVDKTWKEIIDKIQTQINLWKARGLGIRGKVIVINTLLMSKINHALQTCHLPNWAAQHINNMMSTFLWKGKNNLVSHKTIVSEIREGGLGLTDLLSKKRAFRVRKIAKFLDTKHQYPWKDKLADCLIQCGSERNLSLCTILEKKAYSSLPAFYREILEAWGIILPHLKPAVNNKAQILQLPFLLNPCFTHQGAVFRSSHLTTAGLTQLKHIMNEKEEVEEGRVCKTLREKKVKFRKSQILELCKKIVLCVPSEWRELLRQRKCKVQGNSLNFFLCTDKQLIYIQNVKTKTWYKIFVEKIIRRPASEEAWCEIFPTYNIKTIWENIDIKNSGPKIFNTDFKIRHRRIFTGIALHQINKNVYKRECSVCGILPENLEHIFLHCPCLASFRQKLRILLRERCNISFKTDTEWNWATIFGLLGKSPTKNFPLINIILAFARQASYITRNYALHENKRLDTWELFTNLLKTHIKVLHVTDSHHIDTLLFTNTTMCKKAQDNTLKFNL